MENTKSSPSAQDNSYTPIAHVSADEFAHALADARRLGYGALPTQPQPIAVPKSPLIFHPASEIFELLEGDDFKALVEDIRKHGLLNPIWLHPDGSILDGRNRYRACLAAGDEPEFQPWCGDGLAADFVWSLNFTRRHLVLLCHERIWVAVWRCVV